MHVAHVGGPDLPSTMHIPFYIHTVLAIILAQLAYKYTQYSYEFSYMLVYMCNTHTHTHTRKQWRTIPKAI
jgi:hypothetical protein